MNAKVGTYVFVRLLQKGFGSLQPQKYAACFATLLQNELNSYVAR